MDGLRVGRDCLGLSVEEVFQDPKLVALLGAKGEQSRREELEIGDGRVFSAQRTPIEGVGQAVVTQDITHLKELDRIKSDSSKKRFLHRELIQNCGFNLLSHRIF